jgi:hypothetical protein
MAKWKDPGERGDFGAWLTAQVGDRTYDWLAAEMAKRGHNHGASYYRGMAGGSKPPGRAIRRALVEYFGGGPAPIDDNGDDPIRVLAGELREWRTADRDRIAFLERELTDLRTTVARLTGAALQTGGSGGRTKRPALPGSTG